MVSKFWYLLCVFRLWYVRCVLWFENGILKDFYKDDGLYYSLCFDSIHKSFDKKKIYFNGNSYFLFMKRFVRMKIFRFVSQILNSSNGLT